VGGRAGVKRLTSVIVLAVTTIVGVGVATPGAHAISPPCRITPREYRQVRVATQHRLGMTRTFVKEMVGCGGKVVDYQSNGRHTLRTVHYKRTTPAGAIATIIYFDDRVELKCTGPNESCGAAIPPGG
jgi:hypothetical protein